VFIRQKRNSSGTVSIQVIDTSGPHDRLVKTIGSSSAPARIKELLQQADNWLLSYTHQQRLSLEYEEDKLFFSSLKKGLDKILLVGPELILGKLFDEIGFNQIEDNLFRHLVISRLVFPLSKLKTCEYLLRYQNITVNVDQIYRYMDKLQSEQKQLLQQISFQHTLSLFDGQMTIVFYDVTTLYFEASDEDDLRKTGFSKEGKHQHPQIVLGLLVSLEGYPLAFEVFAGNQFEGHTMIPVLEAFKAQFNLEKLIVIADAGLMSSKNMEELSARGYEFIIGARIKNESEEIKKIVLSQRLSDGQSVVIPLKSGNRLIINYARSRAKKDEKNRQRGLSKLEKQLSKGKLSKKHINNRGYNKYLKLEGTIKVSIDYQKFKADDGWDGLKGYVTNTQLTKEQVIENYKNLWQIEKAFRISKTDLRVRPIYHRLPQRIEAHLSIAFCSYKLYKELERQLRVKKSDISVEKALDLMKTIYKLKVKLPKSNQFKEIIFSQGDLQRKLLDTFNINPD
jgi:transposase